MQQAPVHVLVVEDEAVSRDVACELLRHFGCKASAVDNGQAALAVIREGQCDMVLMDYRMLDMDGLETTRRMRAGEAGPSGRTIPIIALTAQAFVADRQACLAAGMNDFLTKPVQADALLAAVQRWSTPSAATASGHGTPPPHATSSPAATWPAVFDPRVIATLPMVADGSQPSYAEVVLNLYLQSVPPLLAQIRQAALHGDALKAQHAAHTLKSSSAAVGALALAACAADVEASLRAGQALSPKLPQRFDLEFDKLVAALGRARGAKPESTPQPC
jgi:CheY-like chemotaxis protein/HPt (histidine-containing phosphotransfer) domain-containing protein